MKKDAAQVAEAVEKATAPVKRAAARKAPAKKAPAKKAPAKKPAKKAPAKKPAKKVAAKKAPAKKVAAKKAPAKKVVAKKAPAKKVAAKKAPAKKVAVKKAPAKNATKKVEKKVSTPKVEKEEKKKPIVPEVVGSAKSATPAHAKTSAFDDDYMSDSVNDDFDAKISWVDNSLNGIYLAPLWQQVWSFLDDNGVIIGIIFVDNVFKYTLNIENYVSNEFKDRMSVIKSATEYATNYLWDKKFNK